MSDPKSWLEKRAEEAARKCESPEYDIYPTVEDMAPHIMAAMREFAERAIERAAFIASVEGELSPATIPKAIKAAEVEYSASEPVDREHDRR